MDFAIFNNTKSESFFNLTFSLKSDVERVVINFDLKIKSDRNSQIYDVRICQFNLDTCNLVKENTIGSLAANYIIEKINQDSNFRLRCPQKKGDFYIRNSPAPDDKAFFFAKYFAHYFYSPWQVTITIRLKATGKSNAARAFFIKIRGETVRI